MKQIIPASSRSLHILTGPNHSFAQVDWHDHKAGVQQDLAKEVKDIRFRGLRENKRSAPAGGRNSVLVLDNPLMVLTESTSYQSLWAVHEHTNKKTPSI